MIKPEELYILALKKTDAEGQVFFSSQECEAPRVLTDLGLKHIRP